MSAIINHSFQFADPSKSSSHCSSLSDGESYECFGENDHMSSTLEAQNSSGAIAVDKDGVDLDLAPHFQKWVHADFHALSAHLYDSFVSSSAMPRRMPSAVTHGRERVWGACVAGNTSRLKKETSNRTQCGMGIYWI